MAAERSRSPVESPVPASMFAPEPSSPGAARAAAAAARLHGGFDSDCSEDGEALNGEPELDLTSKVGPGGGGGGGAGGTRAGRTVSEATAGSRRSSWRGSRGRGKDAARPPAALRDVRGPGPTLRTRQLPPGLPRSPLPPRSPAAPLAPPRGMGLPTPAARPHPCPSVGQPQEGSPRHRVFLFSSVRDARGSRWLGQGAGCSRRQVAYSKGIAGWQPLLFLVPGRKQKVVAQAARMMSEECPLSVSTRTE